MVSATAPVLLIAFNRPDLTAKVFEQIRIAKPSKLFVAVDGARHEKDQIASDKVKKIVQEITWECELKTRYHSKNQGCKLAVSGAITWFFEHVEEGIILEDDCLPCPDFFTFCTNMLRQYRNDDTVGHISGYTLVPFEKNISQNHILIRYSHIWGWATWKNVWQHYSLSPLLNKRFNFSILPGTLNSKLLWFRNLLLIQKNKMNTWDYQYQYMLWEKGLLAISPSDNLIENIGFDNDATHTTSNHRKQNTLIVQAASLRNHDNRLWVSPEMSKTVEDKITKIVFTRNPISNFVRFLLAVLAK